MNCFGEERQILTLTEISRAIDLPKSTTHRFLEAMESQGMLNRDPDGGKYQLGYQMIRWGTLAQASIDLRSEALPTLRSLSQITGETAILSMRHGHTGFWVEIIESRQPIRLAMHIGQRLMLHAGASSKVLWAFLPDAEIEQILQELDLVPLEKNTITEREKLRQELCKIRNQGYATSFEETDNGAMGVAAPVYDHNGQPIAGIGIAAPITRITPDKVPDVARYVLEASRELSRRLGAALKEIYCN